MKRIILIYLLIISISIPSCKKDKDDGSEPVVTNFSTDRYTFTTTDTINYTITVEDDEEVKTVSVYIADNSWNPITSAKVTEVNAQTKTISGTYPFSDRYLENSSYYFICAVSDGNSLVRKPLAITIHPLQKTTDKIFVLADDNGTYKIGSINSSFDTVSFKIILPGKPTDFTCNSYSRQIAVLFEDGSLRAYSYPDYSEEWSYLGLNHPGVVYNTSLKVIDNLIAAGSSFGSIFFFDGTGTIRKSITTSTDAYVQCREFIEYYDKLISYNEGYLTGHSRLSISSLSGGGIISEFPTNEVIRHLTLYESPYILAWTENKVMTFNIDNPFLYQISTFPVSPLNEVIYTGNPDYLLCFDNVVYNFNAESNVYYQQSLNGGTAMYYEPAGNVTVLIKGQSIGFYSSSLLIKEQSYSFTPLKISFLYNK